jgi:hypothetical protein
MPALVILALLLIVLGALYGKGGFMTVVAWPTDRVKRIAEAIAVAEGWNVINSTPRRLNNPGDIRGADGQLTQYTTEDAGWHALYDQIEGMLNGKSSLYPKTYTIAQVAQRYVGMNDPDAMNWARNVAVQLGVSVDDVFSEIA